MTGDCPLCGEPVGNVDIAPDPLHTPAGPRAVHRTCMLRSVIGGIGHLLAHDYWCTQMHDPDAGLTYRQSALLVETFVATVGVDAAARRSSEEKDERRAQARAALAGRDWEPPTVTRIERG